MSSSEDKFPVLKHAIVRDHKAEAAAQAKADVKSYIDDKKAKDEGFSDDDDLDVTFDYTQRESKKAVEIRNTERLFQLANGGRPCDKVRASAYLEAAIGAVEKGRKGRRSLGPKGSKRRRIQENSKRLPKHYSNWEFELNLYQVNPLLSCLLLKCS